MKTKLLVFLAMLLASSTALPVHASDFVLGIFGNANMDDEIDEKDITYLEGVIKGTNPATNLSDANYDGKIDASDLDQIKRIIRGDENEICIVDIRNNVLTINKPVNRVIPFGSCDVEVLRSLNASDKIIAVSTYGNREPYFSEFVDLPCVGDLYHPDYEKIVDLQPDLILTYANQRENDDELANKINLLVPGAVVLRFTTTSQFGCSETTEEHLKYIRTLGYIFDKRDEADDLIDFYTECLNKVKTRTSKLSKYEKPTVFHVTQPKQYFPECHTVLRGSSPNQVIEDAGGINIAADLEASPIDSEWVLSQNPQIILATSSLTDYRMDKATDAEMKAEIDEILSEPGWADFKVYLISGKFCSCQWRSKSVQ